MADLIHDSGGNIVPEQVLDPALNGGQGGMEIVKGSDGAIDVVSNESNITPLANAVTVSGVQPSVSVGNNKTLRIEVYGTATSFAVTLQGIGESGAAYTLTGTNLNGLANVQSITSAGLFQYDVTGLVSVEANVTAVSGGNLNVTGKLVTL